MEARRPTEPLARRREGRLSVPVGIMRAGPVVAIDYAKAKVDGYTETGDPALTLNVRLGERQVLHGRHRRRASRRLRHRRRVGAALSLGDAGEGTGRQRPGRALLADHRAGIVNSWSVGEGSDGAYGRLSAGGSAEILSRVSLNTLLSTTVSREQRQRRFRIGRPELRLLEWCARRLRLTSEALKCLIPSRRRGRAPASALYASEAARCARRG